jgi:hypothetical protein
VIDLADGITVTSEGSSTRSPRSQVSYRYVDGKYQEVAALRVFNLKISDEDRKLLQDAVLKINAKRAADTSQWRPMLTASAFSREAIVQAAKTILSNAAAATRSKGKTKRRGSRKGKTKPVRGGNRKTAADGGRRKTAASSKGKTAPPAAA